MAETAAAGGPTHHPQQVPGDWLEVHQPSQGATLGTISLEVRVAQVMANELPADTLAVAGFTLSYQKEPLQRLLKGRQHVPPPLSCRHIICVYSMFYHLSAIAHIKGSYCNISIRWTFYLSALVYGAWCLWPKPWFADIHHCWIDYPFHQVLHLDHHLDHHLIHHLIHHGDQHRIITWISPGYHLNVT